jgi:hypothetical protein
LSFLKLVARIAKFSHSSGRTACHLVEFSRARGPDHRVFSRSWPRSPSFLVHLAAQRAIRSSFLALAVQIVEFSHSHGVRNGFYREKSTKWLEDAIGEYLEIFWPPDCLFFFVILF